MINHLMSWPLRKDVDRDAATARIRELLEGLVGKVESIRTLSVIENVAYPDVNNDLAILASFDDIAGLDEFVTHPLHQAAVKEIHTLVDGRAGIDWRSSN